MRNAGVLVCAFFCGGCLGDLVPTGKSASQTQSQNDLSPTPSQQPAPTPSDLALAPADLATLMPSSAQDLATGSTLGAFGAVCTSNSDCQSNICQPANMGANMECTQSCTLPNANDPTCPNGGLCNKNSYCKN
jgi:hypothetical protein